MVDTIPLSQAQKQETHGSKKPVNIQDAINRLAHLAPLEYEQCREAEAKKLNIRVSFLDKEVETLRSSHAIKQDDNTMFAHIEPWHDPINPAELLDDICKTVRFYIICNQETAIAATLWIAFTWFIDNMQVAPIAMITAPEKRCGKSQLLALIGKLASRPLVASNISSAAIFRVVEAYSPTLLIDEADSFLRDNEEARGIINSGHTRQSAHIIRLVGDNHEPKQFSTWGAKVICGIGKQADTLMDRSIILELRRKLPHENVARLRHAEELQFDVFKRQLASFSKDAGKAVEQSRPELPDILNDRAQDNWEPLLAIADVAGGHWPETARSTSIKLSGKDHNDESSSVGVMLLTDIRDIFETEKTRQRISTADLLSKLHEMEDRPWPEWFKGKPITPRQIAMHLKPFGVTPKKMRFGYDTGRGYELEQFKDAFDRYLSGTPEQTNNSKGLGKETAGTIKTHVPDKNITNTLDYNVCSTVPDVEVF